ncbi:heterogeneous nuclear ribonucleoprotein L-like [Haplochromis burtoni]|uniref:heterogeneous nuclear ribonucleoprotein L-like n=1 Tax=Haplochromis burtoni TaxID=8153 RepID=UPI0003BC8652|nr:heterogeneous nuclear ribonucleoprotein L-like [Haplochromis burtoni]
MLAVSVRSLIHLWRMKWFRIGLVQTAFHCSCKTATVLMCAFPGPPCPLLPLPGNSRYKLTSLDVPDMVSYPLPQSSSSYSGHAPSSVAMVSGLHPSKMNCTRIFNLFCLYGNIEKVKFMKSVPGTALVEMGDEYAVDRAITHLNSIKVFGKRLNVW